MLQILTEKTARNRVFLNLKIYETLKKKKKKGTEMKRFQEDDDQSTNS